MWGKLIRYLWRPDRLTGVSIQIAAEGAVLLHACTIRVFRNRLHILDQHTGLKNTGHFARQYSARPVALVLSGKGVMTRKVSLSEGQADLSGAAVLQKILPNANADDFYIQLQEAGAEQDVSLMRRAEADQLIDGFESLGFVVVSLSLGTLPLGHIPLPDVLLKAEVLPAYGAAFQALLPEGGSVEVQAPSFLRNRAQAFARARLMRRALLFGLSMLLLLLLNTALYQYYAGKEQALAVKTRGAAAAAGQLKLTESEIGRKAALIRSAGWMGGLNPSFIADRLMAVMPGQLSLQEFSLNPVKKDLKNPGEGPVYEKALIEVTGTCADAHTLNNWLAAIEAYPWVKACKIKHYLANPESGQGVFTIQVQLKEYEE